MPLDLDDHDALSRALLHLRQQTHGLRQTVRAALGVKSPAGRAADDLHQAVGVLQAALLAELDRQAWEELPGIIRTRYVARA
jgi:hypothetical protein